MSIEIVKDYMFFFIFFWLVGNWNKNVGGVFELSYGKFGEFVVEWIGTILLFIFGVNCNDV